MRRQLLASIGLLFAMFFVCPAAENPLPPVAKLKVYDCRSVPLATSSSWKDWPDFLGNATIYEPISNANNELRLEVLEDGLVVLAASWTPDGNKTGGWKKGVSTKESLVRAGWTPIGTITRVGSDNKPDPHTLYRRVLPAGKSVRLHTRKLNAPRVLLVSHSEVAAVMSAGQATAGDVAPVRVVPRLATIEKKKRGETFTDQPGDGAILVGLRLSTDYLAPHWGISSLQPIYEGPSGRFMGQQHGQPGATFIELQARPGYAVGTLIGSVRGNLAGLRIIFFRRTESGLDNMESYESRWVGARSNDQEVKIGGNGKPMVGIRGRASDVVRELELIPAVPE